MEWKFTGSAALQLQFFRAINELKTDGTPGKCPACRCTELRFYCHAFKESPRKRGTIWTWCPSCGVSEHSSRAYLDFEFDDPFASYSLDDFAELERDGWLDRLNELVASKSISQTLRL